MFGKKELEEFLAILTATGVDFAEIFMEQSMIRNFILIDSKLDNITTNDMKGIGIRLVHKGETTYASIDSPTYEEVMNLCKKLASSYTGKSNKKILLKEEFLKTICPVEIPFDEYKTENKIALLKDIDTIARTYSNFIYQVDARLIEDHRDITIVNSNGLFTHNEKNNLRLFISVNAKKGKKMSKHMDRIGKSMGYEMLKEVNIKELTESIARLAIEKLDSIPLKGGRMPVIINKGWGAVLIHEACGHGLEATAVAPGFSVFCNHKGQKVASDKVTLVDDGTIPNEWGSYTIDDEGSKSQKRILIENGILKNYLIDYANSLKMKEEANGCGRRQNYKYAPTSRMSNTYIMPGNDTIETMIKSIDYGIYATNLNGGSVDTNTGDFNFSVDTGFLIENGKLTKRISDVSLIGSSMELLQNIEMVANDLELSDGYCGSESGIIPVTVGQPTLKVSSILVGGMQDE